MSDLQLPPESDPDGQEPQPEVRLELTRAGVEQVLSLYSQEQQERREPGFTLRLEDITEVVRERRRMLASGLAAGIAASLLLLFFATPLYPVSAQVVLERRDVASDGIDTGPPVGGSAFVATQAEVMKSHSVVSAAVSAIPRAAHLEESDDGTADALGSVQASAISGTQVVALGYLGPDAEHGVKLLAAIVEAYRGHLREHERRAQEQRLGAKQAEIEVLELESVAAEARLEALRTQHEILGTGADAAAAQGAILGDATERLTEVRNDRIALENRLATGGELLAVLDPATRTIQEQLWQAEAELARVRGSLKSRHPAVREAKQEVAVLEQQLVQSSRATPEAIQRDIEAARGLEAQLQELYERERLRMAAIERYRREEERLLTELERVRAMREARHGELLDQRLLARLVETDNAGITARLIEAPSPPVGAAWPRPKLVLAGGAGLGLLAGFVAALVSLQQSRRHFAKGSYAYEAPAGVP